MTTPFRLTVFLLVLTSPMGSLKSSSLLVDGRNIDPSHFSQIEANTVRNERRSNATPALRGLLNRALGDLRDELKEDACVKVEKGQTQRSIAAYDSNIVAEVRRETQGRQKGVQRFVLEKQDLTEEDTAEQKDSGGQQDYKRKKIVLLRDADKKIETRNFPFGITHVGGDRPASATSNHDCGLFSLKQDSHPEAHSSRELFFSSD